MIQNDGGKGDYTELTPPMLGIWNTLLKGEADSTWVFTGWESIEAKQKGVELNTFMLKARWCTVYSTYSGGWVEELQVVALPTGPALYLLWPVSVHCRLRSWSPTAGLQDPLRLLAGGRGQGRGPASERGCHPKGP